jgi:hypothetical protein
MSENQPIWMSWASALKRWGMNETVASLLEGADPLSVLFAQVVYLSEPLLSGVASQYALRALAQVLENPVDRRAFASFLREDPARATSA